MIYQINHSTSYEYNGAVSLSHHILRLRPRDLTRQHCLWSGLKLEPVPVVIHTHGDYFGNHAVAVTIEGSHRKLVISSRSQVEVKPFTPPDADKTAPWETALKPDVSAREFIYDSPQIKADDVYAAYAAPSFPPGRPALEAALDLTARIYHDFKFDTKATTIATTVAEFYKTRRGVCQDFAHFEIACLRSMGIPAQYVSGYLETDPPPGKPKLAGSDASHAWVSFFCPGAGWIDLDPTNNLIPSNRHVVVAWGRDYSDVSPVRGVILGSGEHSLKVAVDVLPLNQTASLSG